MSDQAAVDPKPLGMPLGAIFLLIAICGVTFGMIVPSVQNVVQLETNLLAMIVVVLVGFFFGGLFGMVVALCHEISIRSALIGPPIGSAIGIISGILLMTPQANTGAVLISSGIGSGIVLVVALFVRQRSRRPQESTLKQDS